MQEMKPVKEGKVREIYDNGDSLIMVATDRISCFDVILNNEVTKKGTVLTQMSKFWFDMTQDILPNHMISVDVKDIALADTIQYDANRTITRSNSRSGVFNGNYYYTINNSSVTKLCLNVYMPNESGTDYLQGTITLVGNDGTSAPVQIANYSGDSWTLTFTGVKVGVRYHFHYELYSVGSSQVGYIASAAYAQ